jgi:hypothetical protein
MDSTKATRTRHLSTLLYYAHELCHRPVARDLGSRHFVALAIKVQLLHPVKPRAMIGRQWVDSSQV